MKHNFDLFTDLCMGCGASRHDIEDNVVGLECPDNDHVTYFKARNHLEALVMQRLGPTKETRH